MRLPFFILCALSLGSVSSVQAAGSGTSLQDNLRKLEQRVHSAQPKPAPRAAAPRPVRRTRVHREAPRRVVHASTTRLQGVRQSTNDASTDSGGGPTEYLQSRIGVKSRAGDVHVSAAAGGDVVHVYFKQRLVSAGGNGTARIPDIAPGKYPVMVWSPGSGERKTYWVKVRKGATASLTVNL